MQTINKDVYRRLALMEGKLDLPAHKNFVKAIGSANAALADRMFQAIWHAYLKDKGSISLPYWSDQFDNPVVFNQVLMSLAKGNWIVTHSIPARNWAEASLNEDKLLEIVSADELIQIRANNKFKHYILEEADSTATNKTKLNGRIKDTGLVRNGFMLAGKTRFQYDTVYMEQYKDIIRQNLTKSMDKISDMYPQMRKDRASYDTISCEILDYHLANPNECYARGNNINDSRGRAISRGLSKVFNPISNKDARSLLVIPEDKRQVATDKGVRAIHLFIAELLGFKEGKKFQKAAAGIKAYQAKTLHELDYSNESDRADAHENIWLERLYDELDAYYEACEQDRIYYWSTPIELDASALT